MNGEFQIGDVVEISYVFNLSPDFVLKHHKKIGIILKGVYKDMFVVLVGTEKEWFSIKELIKLNGL